MACMRYKQFLGWMVPNLWIGRCGLKNWIQTSHVFDKRGDMRLLGIWTINILIITLLSAVFVICLLRVVPVFTHDLPEPKF